jgi:hypothetical protein
MAEALEEEEEEEEGLCAMGRSGGQRKDRIRRVG